MRSIIRKKHFRERFFFILVSIFFALCLVYRLGKNREEKMKRAALIEAVEKLNAMGFYEEAAKRLRIFPEKDHELTVLLVDTLLSDGKSREAYKAAEETFDLSKDVQMKERLALGAKKNGDLHLAFEYSGGDGKYLKEVRLTPTDEEFVDGWYNGRGIIKKDNSYYLVNEQGIPLDQKRYNDLRVHEKGFVATLGENQVLLDHAGDFLSFDLSGDTKRERDTSPVEKKKSNYSYQGEMLLSEPFLEGSEISARGIGYIRTKEGWFLLRFPALDPGR